jgi:signal transduction histidine kinase
LTLTNSLNQYFRSLARRLRGRFQPAYLLFWDHSVILAFAMAVFILVYGAYKADRGVQSDLGLALLKASADIGHLFQNYDAAKEYTDDEITRLCRTRIEKERKSWPSSSRNFSLSSIPGPVHDSGNHQVKFACAVTPRKWKQFLQEPVWVADVSVADTWKLESAIKGDEYVRAQGWYLRRSAPIAAALFALFIVPYFYREILGVRNFEAAIDTLLTVPLESSTEDDVIGKFPEFARSALHFDSAALYWVSGERLTLRAMDSDHHDGPEASRRRHQPIPLTSDSVEAVVARTNSTLLLNFPTRSDAAVLRLSRSWGTAPYLIVPIFDKEADAVVGVLTAEKVHGFQASNQAELESLMRIAMLLVQNLRSTLRLKDQLRRLMKQTRQVALGTVVPVVAHNLRGGIVIAATAARDLAEKWKEIEIPMIQTRLSQIQEAMQNSSALLERILTYRKLGMTESKGKGVPIELRKVLESICGFFEAYFEVRQIRFEKRFSFDPHVMMDELDLLQVITNLFINADDELREVQAKEGRRCKLSILVERSYAPDGVSIRIADNGRGVPAANRDKIFRDEFTTKEEGTGAGLPYCRQVVQQAGGTVQLDETVTVGATFVIYLPVKDGV